MALAVCVCGFVSLTLTSCGDDKEEEAASVYEVSIIAVLPKVVAPYASLEVTYNDEQGNTKTFTVNAGDQSDAMPQYVTQTLDLMTLGMVDYNTCIVRRVSFNMPAGRKAGCRYKTVLNGKQATEASEGVYFKPFARVLARLAGSEGLVVPSSVSFSTVTGGNADVFNLRLQNWASQEGECTIQL